MSNATGASARHPVRHRRVILVDFMWTRDKDPRVPLGHASIRAELARHASLSVRSVVVQVNRPDAAGTTPAARVLSEVARWPHEDVDVAMGAYVWGEEDVTECLRGLRAAGFRGRIILGGPQVTYAHAGLEAHYPEADLFIRGYAERALAELATGVDPHEIVGVHVAGERDSCHKTNVDLGELRSPWTSGEIPLQGQRFIRWETQRGCPFRCTFCQHRAPDGARLRAEQLEWTRLSNEIDLFCEAGVAEIAVLDPVFHMGKHALPALERFRERGYKGRLSLQCRAEQVKPRFLDAAAQLDTQLEYGLQTIHRDEGRAVQRINSPERVASTLAATQARGIRHEVSIIFGLPHQTIDSFEATVQWCLHHRVQTLKAFPLLVLRGTDLERRADEWGFELAPGPMGRVVQSATMSEADLAQAALLSDALRLTEGRHPGTVAELYSLVRGDSPRVERWQPVRVAGSGESAA